MKITITSITEEGKKGLEKYFPNREYITKEYENQKLTLTIKYKFRNLRKDKQWIIWIINDLRKEHQIETIKDYTIEVKFNE